MIDDSIDIDIAIQSQTRTRCSIYLFIFFVNLCAIILYYSWMSSKRLVFCFVLSEILLPLPDCCFAVML